MIVKDITKENPEDGRKPEEISQTKTCLNEKELSLNLRQIV